MAEVSAVLVTRGDVDLLPVMVSLAAADIDDVVVWDNSERELDVGVYGRYAALLEARHDVVYVQDDDCLVPVQAVLDAYEPRRLVANMPRSRWDDYPDSALIGWGAVFDRDLWLVALGSFAQGYGFDETLEAVVRQPAFLYRTCDVLFSSLTARTIVDVGFSHREFAEGPDRMFRQPGHREERDRMLAMCRKIRAHEDDRRPA